MLFGRRADRNDDDRIGPQHLLGLLSCQVFEQNAEVWGRCQLVVVSCQLKESEFLILDSRIASQILILPEIVLPNAGYGRVRSDQGNPPRRAKRETDVNYRDDPPTPWATVRNVSPLAWTIT